MSARSAARIRTLLLICVALAVAAPPSPGATAAWYHVSEYEAVIMTAPIPRQALNASQWRAGATRRLVTAPGGRVLVVYHTYLGRQVVLGITGDDASPVLTAGWGQNQVREAVVAGGDIYLAADAGFLRVEGNVAVPQRCIYPDDFGIRVRDRPGPEVGCIGGILDALTADGAGNVWISTGQIHGPIRFSADRKNWIRVSGAEQPPELCPDADCWHVPVDVMAGDPARPGLWTYGRHKNGRGDTFYADGHSPGPPYYAGVEFPPPNVAYPRRDRGDTELRRHERSAAPEGVTAPQLQTPLIAADITGRCWLAEGAEGAASIHVFDGQAFTDLTPPPELLKGSQLRQLVCDNARGELLVATSGAGVLVFDGAKWSEHPLNSVLPTVKDTRMKPVDRIAVADDSSVWVATASYLLHWTRGEGE